MSYLGVPRLVFAGRFQADVSTVNNDPEHFNTARFQPSYQRLGQPSATGMTDGWWNPGGTGAWRFLDCVVTSVVYRDGTVCMDPSVDPIVGLAVNGTRDRVEGKLVDLDPNQQMVSEIWGFEVRIGGRDDAVGLGGPFVPTGFADIWPRYPQGQPDSMFGAYYQSVLEPVAFAGAATSRYVAELSSACAGRVSIKFNVDGVDQDATSPTFTLGRVVGAIGPYQAGEPLSFVAARRLAPPPPPASPPPPGQGPAPSNFAAAALDGQLLAVDLGNSLPTSSTAGPPADVGSLHLALAGADGKTVLVGDVNYRDDGWYETTAGIVCAVLTADQAAAAAATPLALVQNAGTPSAAVILAEAANGQWARADTFVFRIDPGDQATTRFFATTFGAPFAGATISLAYDPSQMQGQVDQGPISGPPVVGEPTSALTFPIQITTGADGTAELTLQTADPGRPREYIDGQIYGVTYGLGDSPPPVGSVGNGNLILNVLVFSGYQAPAAPSWLVDVLPIFQQYADLYPVMRPIVDLANYSSVTARLPALRNVFDTPISNPNYMPVTRDLSTAKRTMIRRWLDEPRYMTLTSAEDLRVALQQAVELEHATIPPYLCALYSIKQGTNVEVSTLIRSVVIEEMLHMALASNMLIAIGGAPRIGGPRFVPLYPGPLPGGLRDGLIVHLRRCSIEQIRDVFMSIEQPEASREPVDARVDPLDPRERSRSTIGWFYDEIQRAMEALTAEGALQFGNVERQVTSWTGPGRLFAIASLDDARAAIREIKEQGEGAGPLRPGDDDHELAHYYKFSEIVAGRRLVRTPGGFAYDGAPIPFDPSGVWPMADDPDITRFPPGSRAAILTEQFAITYQSLLDALNRTFNGDPDHLRAAVGVMFSLDLAARELMQTRSGLGDGTTAGPSFQIPFRFSPPSTT